MKSHFILLALPIIFLSAACLPPANIPDVLGDDAGVEEPLPDVSISDAELADAQPQDATLFDVAAQHDASAPDAGAPDVNAPDVVLSLCGDGEITGDEICDDGDNNGRYGFCNNDCSGDGARCGDGRIDAGFGELCDDGVNDGAYGGCNSDCLTLAPRCGNGVIDDISNDASGTFEACDDGENDGAYGGCNSDCLALANFCGDGEVTDDEICDDGVNDDLGGGCRPGCEREDTSDVFYDKALVNIDITMSEDNWNALTHEYKSRHNIFFGQDCRKRQVPNPYNYYPGDVVIDGERVGQVGFRKRGHLGSGSTTKPSLKLKFDEYVDGQRYQTMKRFAINNSKSDPGYMRTCFTYESMRQAGVPAPRCTYAKVSLNGDDLGVYVVVEEIKKPFLRRHFNDDGGNLYEGTATDWREDFFGGFEQETNLDDPSREDLQRVFDALEVDDDQLESALDQVVNLDEFYRFWAVESLIWHRDGYAGNANNYFIYADPDDNGRFRFLPWGPDSAFREDNRDNVPDSVLARSRITFRLYNHLPSRARYYEELNLVRQQLWDPAFLLDEVDRIELLLRDNLRPQDINFDAGLAEMRAFLLTRNTTIDAVIEEGFPDWVAGMRTLPCRVFSGDISGTFSASYGLTSLVEGVAGNGTLTFEYEGERFTFDSLGVRFREVNPTRRQLQMAGYIDDIRWLFTLNIPVNDPYFDVYNAAGNYAFISPPFSSSLIERDLPGRLNLRRGDAGEGVLIFDQYSEVEGETVSGRFDASLYINPIQPTDDQLP